MPFEVEQVIGSGSVQELICQPITFPAPAEEVKEIRKTVIIDNCLVVWDKVIVDGRLRKDIMFKQAAAGFPIPGNVAACTGVVATITGPIFDVDVDIAFNAMIPVPGARPGDKCVFLQAFVEGEKEEAADIQANGSFNTLLDKSIVFLCVKVVRDVITNNLTGTGTGAGAAAGQTPPICPPRRSTGFFPGGDGSIPAPRPGFLPGTYIGPTLVFGGVLNPGIPTTFPPATATINTLGTQVLLGGQTGTTGTGTGTGAGGTANS